MLNPTFNEPYKPILDTPEMWSIYFRYSLGMSYRDVPQGKCLEIAKDMQSEFGGKLVFGYLDYKIGQRAHWWCETETHIIDPMFICLKEDLPCQHLIEQSIKNI